MEHSSCATLSASYIQPIYRFMPSSRVPSRMTPNGWPIGLPLGSSQLSSSSPGSSRTLSPSTGFSRWVLTAWRWWWDTKVPCSFYSVASLSGVCFPSKTMDQLLSTKSCCGHTSSSIMLVSRCRVMFKNQYFIFNGIVLFCSRWQDSRWWH